jgi:hypothetical protein
MMDIIIASYEEYVKVVNINLGYQLVSWKP